MTRHAWLATLLLCASVSGCPAPGPREPIAPAQSLLSIHAAGPGVVVSEPPGIYCGDTCSAKFNRGSVVTLSAKPGPRAMFTGWQGPCTGKALCLVTMSSDATVTATWAFVDTSRSEPPGDAGDPADAAAFETRGGDDPDGDGMASATDKCPHDPEDRDGFEDADGCPDTDNDADGIGDVDDLCPNAAEDRDGFQDEDGCPDPDNDRDGILDIDDRCPGQPETMNGFDDDDGCPDRA